MFKDITTKKKKKFRSLTTTLAVIFLLLTLAILLITSGLETYLSFKTQQKAIASQEQLIAKGAADTVKSFIQEKINSLETTAKFGYLSSFSQIESSLEILLSLEPAFRQLILLDEKKQELSRVSRVSKTESDQLIEFDKDKVFVKLNEKEIYISPVYIHKVTNEPMVVIAVPVENAFGDIKGALVADLKLKFMWDLVDQLEIGKQGLAYVVDRKGNLIAFGDVSRVLKGENLSSLKKVSEFIKGGDARDKNSIVFSKGILGTDVVSDYVPLGTPDWATVVELPATEAYAGVINQLGLTVLIVILIIAFGSGLGVYLSKIITRPVISLRNAAEEMSRGNLNTIIDIKSKDEIGELAADFNNMAREIRIRTKRLSEGLGRLQSLVESVKLGVVMVDLSLNVTLANQAARKILGKSPSDKLTFEQLSEKIKGNIDISQALSFYVKSGKTLNIKEAMIGDKCFRFFMSPVRDVVDKIFIGAVMIMEDITEEKKLDRMKTEIVSITSHQLRTPSTIIKGNLEMLLGGDIGQITPKQKDVLNDVYLGNERMIRLINDLMDAAKIEEGKFKLAAEPAKLEKVVAEIVREISPLAARKKVRLIYDEAAKDLPEVTINIARVKQVLQNLIVNAIQYSAIDDKGIVEVDIKQQDKFIVFSVKDNGVGIPKDEQDKLFNRFFRGSNVTKLDPGGGSGLGLYIAKAVIEQGGGKISFVSEENKGTTFEATFPIK